MHAQLASYQWSFNLYIMQDAPCCYKEPAVGEVLCGMIRHACMNILPSAVTPVTMGVTELFMGCALSGALLGVCGACTHPEPV